MKYQLFIIENDGKRIPMQQFDTTHGAVKFAQTLDKPWTVEEIREQYHAQPIRIQQQENTDTQQRLF